MKKTQGTDNAEICRRHLIVTTWCKSSHNLITQPFYDKWYDQKKKYLIHPKQLVMSEY